MKYKIYTLGDKEQDTEQQCKNYSYQLNKAMINEIYIYSAQRLDREERINNEEEKEEEKKNTRNIHQSRTEKLLKKKKKIIKGIFISLGVILPFILLIILLYYFVFKKKGKSDDEKNYEEEKLIVKLNYNPNNLLKFRSEKTINLEVNTGESEVGNDDNSNQKNSKNMIQYTDFIFIIREKKEEKDGNNLISKNIYTGYIGILNVTLNNGTNDMTVVYDEKLSKSIKNEKNLRNIDENPDLNYVDEKNKLCFIKIEFYENGEIKNIFLPKDFEVSNMVYMNEIIKLIIPKISPKLYSSNIESKIDEIESAKQMEDYSNYTDILNSTDLFNINLRLLSNYSNDENNGTLEQYISSSSSSKSSEADLRQITKNENSSIEDGDFINLTEISINDLKDEQIDFEGNYVKKIIYSKIDHSGNLYSIKEIQSSVMSHDNDFVSETDEGKLEQIYNKDNMISLEDTIIEDEESDDNNFKFNLSSIIYETINNIDLSENSNVEEINKKVFNYFDSFNYSLYNENENNQTYLRFLQYKEQVMKENNWNESEVKIEVLPSDKLRQLDNSNNYYGLNKALYDKNLYKHNLLGLKLEGETSNEMGFSDGKASNNFIMKFGNINTKFDFKEKNTNTNIAVERINQMIFKLINLLNKSNKDLNERNKIYSEIIIDLEKNTSELFTDTFDYSNLFRNNLNDMYKQVQNFTGVFFKELIELINKVHKNYLIILNNAKLNKYEMLNQILIITKNEYINYIYDMVDILGGFKNNTLKFLHDIENELTLISSFQIDFLYDIIDSIYECKFIFINFNRNLFKAIEKGILTFKYDIRDYIDEIIGDLLYITDFLSININKNEILINAFNEKTRMDLTKKLRDFRDIILTIMDIFINNINSDYEKEMSINNKKSIKFYSEDKVKQFVNEIEHQSNEVIKQIKLKIEYMERYENYSNNIDTINNINNETIIEFNEDIYKKILLNLSEIQPEYLKKDSEINVNKNKAFNISKKLTNEINKEIEEINNYISSYSYNYLKENLYDIHYNLFYFRKYFLDDEMEKLLNEFKKLINQTINEHYKKLIDNNYKLALIYVQEEASICSHLSGKTHMTSFFIQIYHNYISYFQEFLYLMCSDDFLNLIEVYFYKIRDTILNYVDQKVSSINSYYFNNELYKRHFYLIEKINEEIYKIIDNINNYYEEMILIDLQIKAAKLALDVLKPYNQAKESVLNHYYNVAKGTCNYVRGSHCDVLQITKRKIKNCFHHEITHRYCPHRNNINKVLRDLSKTNAYLNENSNIIIKNFINKFDKYLNNYVFYAQSLYNNLYTYYEDKINNHENIQTIFNEYNSIINESLANNSNSKIMERIDNKLGTNFANLMNKIIIKFGNNVEQIKNMYFSPIYLHDYNNFLEYPEELVYKTNQFMNDLKNSTDFIENKINLSYQKKLLSVVNLTCTFIKNINNLNLEYIITHIKFHSIIEKYFDSKRNELETIFKQLNDIVEQQYKHQNNITLLNESNYNNQMKNIIDEYSNFSSYFFEVVEQNFTIEICNNTDTDNPIDEMENKNISNNCWVKKFKSDLNYSEYNFMVVKIRTGLYYIKNLLNNINTYFDEFNYDNILNIQQINKEDKCLNDKNILYIHNESLFKLNEIKNQTFSLLEEPFEYFIDEFKYKYTFDKDFFPFYKDLENILKYNHKDFFNNATLVNNKSLEFIHSLLDNFNETLYKQLFLKEKYDYYNINKTYFDLVYLNYNKSIQNCFQKYKNKIKGLNHSFGFYNSLRLTLRKLQINKRNYYKNLINDFAQQFDFKLLNMTYDLGEEVSKYLLKDYDDYEFSLVYDYFQLFYNNTDNYIKLLIEDITNIEKDIQYYLKIIYDEFKDNYERNISYFVTYDYIEELKYNFTNCINYSYDKLDKMREEDDINYQKYLEYLNLVEEYENCSKKSDLIDNFNCTNISNIEPVVFFNKTKHLLNCYDNNYFNYKVIIFETFNQSYKNTLDNIILNITNRISSNYIDEIFLNNYLEKYYHFDKLNATTIKDLYYYFEDFENMIFYINYKKNEEYKNTLYNSLIYSFNSSYSKFLEDYIIKEISDNITFYLNDKLGIFIHHLKMKISFESYYYLFLLNNTKELGISSKNALINLYRNFKNKLNETLFYLIEEDVFFYINLFYRENKKTLRNHFIDYYYNNDNEYNIDIFKLKYYFDEIIYDKLFNKTLDEISDKIINNMINKIKTLIYESTNTELQSLYKIIDNSQIEIENNLGLIKTKEIPDDMTKFNELIVNYTILVQNQNNRFNFVFSEKPFDSLHNFTKNELEPPLILIKELYNSIEERLIMEITKIVDSFPDYYSLIKEKLFIESRLENATEYLSEINSTLYNYSEDLSDDLSEYFNKLVHFAYINGINTFEKECTESYCSVHRRNDSKPNNFSEEEVISIIFGNYTSLSFSDTKKKRNQNIDLNKKYLPSMGPLTKDDIFYYLYNIQNTLYSLNKTYLSKEYKNISRMVSNFIKKVNFTYLVKLERSFEFSLLKFSTVLTEPSFIKMKKNVYKQYYQIENYINEMSNITKNLMDGLVDQLNKTSLFIKIINSQTFFKVLGYYNVLSNYIQSKIRHLDNFDNIRNLGDNPELYYSAYFSDEHSEINEIYNRNEEFIDGLKKIGKENYKNITGKLLSIFSGNENGNISIMNTTAIFDKIKDLFTKISPKFKLCLLKPKEIEFNPPLPMIIIPLPILPALQLRIIPKIYFKVTFKLNCYNEKSEIGAFININLQAEVSLSLELGFYIPGINSPVELAVCVGLKGVLGAGKVGIRLEFNLNQNKLGIYLDCQLETFALYFYIQFRFTIDIEITKLTFEFYIVNQRLFGIYKETHKKIEYKFLK